MFVVKTDKKIGAIPDYYSIYLRWLRLAKTSGSNAHFVEAQRYARLAEEFGLAVINDDETIDF